MVTVYTMDYCPYCERAKQLLKQRGIQYQEKRVPMDDEAEWNRLEKLTKMKTMPMIFKGNDLIGGYQDLSALDSKDKLESLKKS